MYRSNQLLKLVRLNFMRWRKNPRIIITFVLAFVLSLMLSDKTMSFAMTYGTTMQILEVFIWTFGDANSVMLSSLLLVLLFADMPFIGQETPYFLMRTNRKTWVMAQIIYVAIATVLFQLFILCSTCLISARISFLGNQWSETAALLGYSGIGMSNRLPITTKLLELSFPYESMLVIFALTTLYSLLVANIMMAFNLYGGSSLSAVSGFGINLYGLLLSPQIFIDLFQWPESLKYRANIIIGWLSPLNHATYSMHNFGYDYLPRLWVSCLLFIAAIILLGLISFRRVKKYEFVFMQGNE